MLHLRHDECMSAQTLHLAPPFLFIDWIAQRTNSIPRRTYELLGDDLRKPLHSSIDHGQKVRQGPQEREAAREA